MALEYHAAPIVGISFYSEVLYFYAPPSCFPKRTLNNLRAETATHILYVTSACPVAKLKNSYNTQ